MDSGERGIKLAQTALGGAGIWPGSGGGRAGRGAGRREV